MSPHYEQKENRRKKTYFVAIVDGTYMTKYRRKSSVRLIKYP